jgi:phosphatidylserine synthase
MLFILLITGAALWIIRAPIADTKAHLLLTVKSALWLGITGLLLLQTLPTKKLSMAKRQVPFYATVVVLLAVLCFMISAFLQAHLRQLLELWMRSELL